MTFDKFFEKWKVASDSVKEDPDKCKNCFQKAFDKAQ